MTKNTEYIPARQVWERYGVTSMTLYRWLADEKWTFRSPFTLVVSATGGEAI